MATFSIYYGEGNNKTLFASGTADDRTSEFDVSLAYEVNNDRITIEAESEMSMIAMDTYFYISSDGASWTEIWKFEGIRSGILREQYTITRSDYVTSPSFYFGVNEISSSVTNPPNAPNGISPVITNNLYSSANYISITCETEGADIRYTLDGSDPTEESTLYSGQFEVTPPVTIKARGYKEGLLVSDVASYEMKAPVPVTVPMALPDGSVLFYDRGTSYGEYKINDSGYPERIDGAVDDGSAESQNWRYLICDQHDLVNQANPTDKSFPWGASDTDEGLTGTSIGVGLPNTESMIAKYGDDDTYCWGHVKEKRDSAGLKWFMPSKDELDMMYDNRTVITGQGGDAFKTDIYYWSSSEYDSTYAWRQNFSLGNQNGSTKTSSNRCRLLRRI